jgi:adenine phosphoribosyltransferase
MSDLARYLRDVPDFPKPGILFKDITPLLADPAAYAAAIEAMAAPFSEADVRRVVGIESRGFIFGSSLAQRFDVGFAPARKIGKLPWKTRSRSYALEYGEATLELHEDAVRPGEPVLIVDDLLATGGTARAVVELVRELGARVVGVSFLIELGFLGGRAQLDGVEVHAPIQF